YKEFNTINNYFSETQTNFGATMQVTQKLINKYCHYGNTPSKCHDYYQRASSGVIYLLKSLEKYGLEYDKLAEYAILWLSYKLNIKPKNKLTDLNKFYTSYIVNNKCYNDKINGNDGLTYKEIINKKDLMNMNIKEILKFYEALKTLCNMYSECNKSELNCKKCSNDANKFADQFKELIKDYKNIENSSYSQMISTLSDDYNNLKNKYDSNNCTDFPSLPEIEPQKISVENSGKDSRQPTALSPEATSSSSSISTTLIPALSIVSVIPVFLGIAYK
ncbi:hypothetical protein YYG_05204, partial [Plasmodium vinckei petteri]